MNYKLIYSALRARYRLFVLILATTLLTTIAISLIMPKTYVAKGSLLLDGKDQQSMRTTNEPQPWDRAGYVRTQMDIVTSSKVARRVVADLKLAENPEVRADYADSGSSAPIQDWLVENLLKYLKVETTQGSVIQQSSVVQLSFPASDATYAAQVVNGFAKAYVDTVLDLRIEPTRQTSVWFDEQMKMLRANMEQAERRLTAFQQEHGIISTDDRFDAENVQLSDLVTQVARAQVPTDAQVADISNLPGGLASPAIQTVKGELMRSEAKLQQMSAELGSKHPQYQRQQAEVQSLRDKLGREIDIVVSDAKTAARNSRAHMDQLLGAIKQQQQRMLGLKTARNELALLSHDVDIAQRTYETAMQRFMASKIESRALQTNVAVLDLAVPPTTPDRPKLFLNIAIALAVGVLLGLAAVFLAEMFDRRVRWLDDLSADPQVPLLAVLNTWDPAANRLLGAPASHYALPNPG